MRPGDEHLSDLALERWLAGELVPEAGGEGASAGEHLSHCAACQTRHRRRSDDRSAFARRSDLRALAEATWRAVGEGTSRTPVRWWSWSRFRLVMTGGLVATAAAAAAAVLVARGAGSVPDGLRAKGGVKLELFVKHPDGTVASMLPDDAAAPGDRLRFRVGTPRDGFVAIVSIDGTAGVTGYLPVVGSLPAVQVGTHLLDGAVELDAVLGRERLLAFLCSEPLDATTVIAGVRGALESAGGDPARLDSAPVQLPCTFTSFWFRKVRRP